MFPSCSGHCKLVAPVELALDCRLGAIGKFLPALDDGVATALRVVALPEDQWQACSPLEGKEPNYYKDAVVVARRGECSFQDKVRVDAMRSYAPCSGWLTCLHEQLKHVASAGGAAMVVVNTEDEPLDLGALDTDEIPAIAVSMALSQGEELLAQVTADANARLEIYAPVSEAEQARLRLQHFAETNTQVAAFHTFWQAVHNLPEFQALGSFEEIVAAISQIDKAEKVASESPAGVTQMSDDAFEFLVSSSFALSWWTFADEAVLHGSTVAAASLMLGSRGKDSPLSSKDKLLLQLAAQQLISAGYFVPGRVLLSRLLEEEAQDATEEVELHCRIAITRFLEADLLQSIPVLPKECAEVELSLGNVVPSLLVGEQALYNTAAVERTPEDDVCLSQAAGESKAADNSCCKYVAIETEIEGEDNSTTIKRELRFKSQFVGKLYNSLNLMGVFLDEIGAFDESLRFFDHAERLCPNHDGQSVQVCSCLSGCDCKRVYVDSDKYLECLAAPCNGCAGGVFVRRRSGQLLHEGVAQEASGA